MIIKNFYEFQKEIDTIIKIVSVILKKYEKELLEILAYTEKRISGYSKEDFPLKQIMDVDFEKIPLHLRVFGYNEISLFAKPEENECINLGFAVCDIIMADYSDNSEKMLTEFKALNDKKRFEILMLLKNEKLSGTEIAQRINVSTPTVSHHMSILVNSEFVCIDKKNGAYGYILNPKAFKQLSQEIIETFCE